jgi:hypothetical protein
MDAMDVAVGRNPFGRRLPTPMPSWRANCPWTCWRMLLWNWQPTRIANTLQHHQETTGNTNGTVCHATKKKDLLQFLYFTL